MEAFEQKYGHTATDHSKLMADQVAAKRKAQASRDNDLRPGSQDGQAMIYAAAPALEFAAAPQRRCPVQKTASNLEVVVSEFPTVAQLAQRQGHKSWLPDPRVIIEVDDEDLDLDLDLDISHLMDCFAPEAEALEDTERGPLDGVGMGSSCPTGRASTKKEVRAVFHHLSGESKGNKREAQGYIWRDNKRVKTGAYKAYGAS